MVRLYSLYTHSDRGHGWSTNSRTTHYNDKKHFLCNHYSRVFFIHTVTEDMAGLWTVRTVEQHIIMVRHYFLCNHYSRVFFIHTVTHSSSTSTRRNILISVVNCQTVWLCLFLKNVNTLWNYSCQTQLLTV